MFARSMYKERDLDASELALRLQTTDGQAKEPGVSMELVGRLQMHCRHLH